MLALCRVGFVVLLALGGFFCLGWFWVSGLDVFCVLIALCFTCQLVNLCFGFWLLLGWVW